jgi:hypothetical protein
VIVLSNNKDNPVWKCQKMLNLQSNSCTIFVVAMGMKIPSSFVESQDTYEDQSGNARCQFCDREEQFITFLFECLAAKYA